MKRIRNRKLLQYKRRRYSLLLRSFRMSMQEFFQTAAELTDEAEFEARVAAKLTDVGCPKKGFCEGTLAWHCNTCRLKAARLAVEEEMENETH